MAGTQVQQAPTQAAANQTNVDLSGKYLAMLYGKSMCKLLMIIFIALQFYMGPFVNYWVILIVFIVGYFSMPTSYKEDEPYKTSEAWIRMVLGLLMAITLMAALTPEGIEWGTQWPALASLIALSVLSAIFFLKLPSWLGILITIISFSVVTVSLGALGKLSLPFAIFFLTLAFFMTAPKKKSNQQSPPSVIFQASLGKGGAFRSNIDKFTSDTGEAFGNGLFFALAIAGGIPILQQMFDVKTGTGFTFGIIMLMVWALSLFMGFMGGREGRPYIGIFALGMAMFSFAFLQTGTLGVSLFGPYWAMVETSSTSMFEPFGDTFSNTASEISFQMECVTKGPFICDALKKQREKEKSTLKEGTFKSIEFKPSPIRGSSIDPAEPFLGSFELTNEGTYTAKNLVVVLGNDTTGAFQVFRKDSADTSAAKGEKWELVKSVFGTFRSCGDVQPGGNSCEWRLEENKEILPKTTKMFSVIYRESEAENNLGELYKCKCLTQVCVKEYENDKECKWKDDKDKILNKIWNTYTGKEGAICQNFDVAYDCNDNCIKGCIEDTDKKKQIVTYAYPAHILTFPITYKFDYSISASMNLEVMGADKFSEYLKTKQLREETSNYHGGPIMIAIWTENQPIKAGELMQGEFSITNKQDGIVLSEGAEVNFSIPNLGGTFDSNGFKYLGGSGLNCDPPNIEQSKPEITKIACTLDHALENEKVAKYKFLFRYNGFDVGISKTAVFTADTSYTYEKQVELAKRPLAGAPEQ